MAYLNPSLGAAVFPCPSHERRGAILELLAACRARTIGLDVGKEGRGAACQHRIRQTSSYQRKNRIVDGGTRAAMVVPQYRRAPTMYVLLARGVLRRRCMDESGTAGQKFMLNCLY